ncbi:MAG: TlpA family protein disulfide reductase [Chitinophagaceae bacterium]|nr:TlpA family protein disulfide reductase [Chitinophagaceae bacterium]
MIRVIIILFYLCSIRIMVSAQHESYIYIINTTKNDAYIRKANVFLKGSFPYVVRKNGEAEKIPVFQHKPLFVNIRFYKSELRQYLVYPNDTLYIKEDFQKCPIIERTKQQNQNEILFMNELFTKIKELNEKDVKGLPKTISLKDRNLYITNIYKKPIVFLENNKSRFNLSSEFVSYFLALMKSIELIKKVEFQVYKYVYASSIKNFYEGEFKTLISQFNNPKFSNIYEYQMASYLLLNTVSPAKSDLFEQATKIFTDSITAYRMQSKILYDRLNNNDTTAYQHTRNFLSQFGDSLIKAQLTGLFNMKVNRALISDTETFLIDEKGVTLKMSDFLAKQKDTLVFIDFWASWCKPCIDQHTYTRQLQASLKDKPIKFVFLSLDEDFINWTSAIKAYSLRENSFLLQNAFKSNLAQRFSIESIPRYLLIGKDGTIINENAPRPSNPALNKLILKSF